MRTWLIVLALCVGAPALADALSDVRAREAEMQRLDGERAQLDARRIKLETDSQRLAGQIDTAKAEPAGVGRDARLQDLLARQQVAADELQKVAAQLRQRSQAVWQARRVLMGACDKALQTNLPEARRLELARLRTAQATMLATPPQPLGIGKATADALDGPRELQEKADLLRDSQDKLKREVQRLAGRIDDVERRRHLRERAGAIDDDVFGELSSNRRVARAQTSAAGATGGRGAGDSASSAAPTAGGATGSNGAGGAAPGAGGGAGSGAGGPVSGGVSGGGSGAGGGSNPAPPSNPGGSFGGSETGAGHADTTVLRNLVDPSTLDELRRADSSDDLERQVRALKRAQGELDGLARELEKRARALSSRADELKHKK